MNIFYVLFLIMQCGLLAALILLIVGLCLRRRSIWICAPIIFASSCTMMLLAVMIPNILAMGTPRISSYATEIDEHDSQYFIVDELRYEALEITQTYVHKTNEGNDPTYYYVDGFAEIIYYQVPNSGGYDIVKKYDGKIYCRAEQKVEITEFLSDTEHPVWYGIRTDGNTHRLPDELVEEVLDFCKSAQGTEEIYLSDCKNITLTKTIGGLIDQGSFVLQLYGGQAYYGVDGAMAPLPADLSNRLVTALDE